MEMANNYKWRSSPPRIRPIRREWAFQESLRRFVPISRYPIRIFADTAVRVATIFSIIDLLLEGLQTPEGYTCHSNGNAFGENTLPCNRDIWEARTTKTWMMHYDRYLSTKESDENLVGHHLLESKLSNTNTSVATKVPNPDVVRWCEGLDSLGTLVWMALPLHRHRLRQNSQVM